MSASPSITAIAPSGSAASAVAAASRAAASASGNSPASSITETSIAARAQIPDDAARKEIAAGELIDRPRNDKRELHANDPSNAAQADRRFAQGHAQRRSAPAVPSPSAPDGDARLEAAENLAGQEFGRGVAALEGGQLVEIAVVDLAEHGFQRLERLADVADETVGVELGAAHLDLDRVGRAVQPLRRTENLADETMRDHHVIADGKRCTSLENLNDNARSRRARRPARREPRHALRQRVERAVAR